MPSVCNWEAIWRTALQGMGCLQPRLRTDCFAHYAPNNFTHSHFRAFLKLFPHKNILPSPFCLKCHPSSAGSSPPQELWAWKTLVQAPCFTAEEMASRGFSLAQVHKKWGSVLLRCVCFALCSELPVCTSILPSIISYIFICILYVLARTTWWEVPQRSYLTHPCNCLLAQFSAYNLVRWNTNKWPSFF